MTDFFTDKLKNLPSISELIENSNKRKLEEKAALQQRKKETLEQRKKQEATARQIKKEQIAKIKLLHVNTFHTVTKNYLNILFIISSG